MTETKKDTIPTPGEFEKSHVAHEQVCIMYIVAERQFRGNLVLICAPTN